MAEGFLRDAAPEEFEVFSAGTDPIGVHPLAIAVMKEAGVDISEHSAKAAASLPGDAFHYVVTVCDRAKEKCPVFPGALIRLHWPFDDPAEPPPT
jgi:arsenate reductase